MRLADRAALQAAMEELPPPLLEVVLLCDLEEMKYKEIAAVLDVPIGTVMSRDRAGARGAAADASGWSDGSPGRCVHDKPSLSGNACCARGWRTPDAGACYAAQEHLAGCATCTSSALAQTLLKSATARAGQRYAPPPELAARLSRQIAREAANAQAPPRPARTPRRERICCVGLGDGRGPAGCRDTVWKLVPGGKKRQPENGLGFGQQCAGL